MADSAADCAADWEVEARAAGSARSAGWGCPASAGGISPFSIRSCTRTQVGLVKSLGSDSSDSLAVAVALSWQSRQCVLKKVRTSAGMAGWSAAAARG